MSSIRLERLSFAFADSAPVVRQAELRLGPGWTGLVGPNGAGKTTLLRLLAGDLVPDEGRARVEPEGARIVLCPQEVAVPDDRVRDLVRRHAAGDPEARRLTGAFALEGATATAWSERSPGERKRWQVAGALAASPDVLLLDEPTNHLDARGRTLLLAELAAFDGVGMVVSHDRALLEALTSGTVRLERGTLRMLASAYGEALRIWEAEARRAWELRSEAQREVRKSRGTLADARRDRAEADRERNGGRRDPRDRDARTLAANVRRDRAEASLARRVRVRRARAERAEAAVPDVPPEATLGRSIFLGFERSPRPVLLGLEAAEVRAGPVRVARDVAAWLGREDRVRLTAPNGAGKTTLVEAMLARSSLPEHRILYLPQELPAGAGRSLLDEVRGLSPETRGRVLALAASLGVEPGRLLASSTPSPGETRKLALALGMGRHAWALVLDEPTNHLDLPTVERLEQALEAYPGALLLVTHDDAFAAAITRTTWRLEDGMLVR